MSWKDELQPCRVGDVQCYAEQRRGGAGRRYQLHEYPHRNEHWAEDMGAHAAPETLQVFLIGADHFAQREKLIEQLNKPGPITLVHPSRGVMRVQFGQCPWSESTKHGGMTTFTLNFIQSGVRKYPVSQTSTVADVDSVVNSGLNHLQTQFNQQFKTSSLPAWVAESSAELIQKGMAALEPIVNTLSLAGDTLRAVNNAKDNVLSLVTQPLNMATTVVTLLEQTYSGLTDISAIKNATYSLTSALGDDSAQTVPSTPSRHQQADNRNAITQLYGLSASLLAARRIVELSKTPGSINSPFDSYDHAIAIRDALLAELDGHAAAVDDEMYIIISDLQTAVINHITAHGIELQKIASYTPRETVPALVIAHRLYGDGSWEQDLIRRNGIRHPGFTPAGSPLEVLYAS